MSTKQPLDRLRLDKWLWAARFFKTRSLATAAVDGGKVRLNGERAKPSKQVQVGDEVKIRSGLFEYQVFVHGLSERRGPAKHAATLYEETAASRRARERLAAESRSQPTTTFSGKGRPTKRDRRQIDRWRKKSER